MLLIQRPVAIVERVEFILLLLSVKSQNIVPTSNIVDVLLDIPLWFQKDSKTLFFALRKFSLFNVR